MKNKMEVQVILVSDRLTPSQKIQWKFEYTENFEKERVKDTIDLYRDLRLTS